MADLKNILSNSDEQLREEELLKYLDDNLSHEEKYATEKKINNNPFEVDALQGLAQLQNKDSVEKHVHQLNLKLHQLTAKKPPKSKKKIRVFEWIILAILVLLFVCVASYAIIYLHSKNHLHI